MSKYVLILCLLLCFTSCSIFEPKTVVLRIKGSDTMFAFTEMLAREYMRLHPYAAIYVYGGGSREGIESISDGTADIATASRLLSPDEVKILADIHGSIGITYLVAKDAISIYVHPDNPVKNFTLNQLYRIFTCRINNWKELGGEDHSINIITRSPSSGTYTYFQQFILTGDKYCEAATVESTGNRLANRVSKDKYAIGFGGIGLQNGIVHASVNGIEATDDNVRNDLYPISRYLYFITLKNPRGAIKDFIDWTFSNEAQSFIQRAGYVPIWKVTF